MTVPETAVPRYWTIKEHLKKQLTEYELQVGDKIKPNDLMREFNVSNITVNRALKELTDEGFLKREKGSGTVVVSNKAKSDKSLVCMLIPTGEDLWEELYFGILRGLNQNRDHVLTYSRTNEELSECWDELLDFHINCFVFNGMADFPYDLVALAEPAPFLISVVFGERQKKCSNMASVIPDYDDLGYQSAVHLIECGYKKIIYFTAPGTWEQDNQKRRIKGIENALAEHNMPELIFGEYNKAERRDTAVFEGVLRDAGKGSAVICSYDFIASDVYLAAQRVGFNIGTDLGVVGCFDTPWCQRLTPKLTTMSIQNQRISDEVKRLVREQNPGKIIIPPKLIVRQSTKPE